MFDYVFLSPHGDVAIRIPANELEVARAYLANRIDLLKKSGLTLPKESEFSISCRAERIFA